MSVATRETYDEYVYAVNAVLEEGREDLAWELADAYDKEARSFT